jgi:hypothetical protein
LLILIFVEIYLRRESYFNWTTLNGNDINYLPWSRGEPNGGELGDSCIILKQDPMLYFDVTCETQYCFACQFQGDTLFKLRGLCLEQELIDTDYIFMHSFIQIGVNVINI